jgi:hypothetical protein
MNSTFRRDNGLKMKIRDITESSEKLRKSNSNDTLRDLLSVLLNTIEKFENNGNSMNKNSKDKTDILKNMLSDMIKDEDQRRTIKGEQ